MKRRRKLGDGNTSPRSRLRALLDAVASTSQEVADAEEPESAARVIGAAQNLQAVLTDLAADNEQQLDEQQLQDDEHQVESARTITGPIVGNVPHEEYYESLLEAFDCLLEARFLLLRERYRLAVNVAQCEVWQREYDQRIELDRQQQLLLGRQPQTLMSYLAYEENLVPSTPDSLHKSVDRSGVPLFRRKYEWSVRKWASKDHRRIIAAVAQKAQTDYTLLVAERLSLTQAAIDAVFSAAQEPLVASLEHATANSVIQPQSSRFSLAGFHTFLQSQLADLPPHVTAEAQLPAINDSNIRNSYAADKALRSLSPLSRDDLSRLQRVAHLSIESTLSTLGSGEEGVNSDAADARLELLGKELFLKLQRIQKAVEYNTPALFCNFLPLDFAKPRLAVTSALTYLSLHHAAAAKSTNDASANNAADVVGETALLGPTLQQYWANFWVSIAETHHCESTGREVQMHWIHHISSRVNHSAFNKNELAVLEAAVQFYKRDEETAIVDWEYVAQRVSHEATQQNDEQQQRHHCNRTAFQCYEAYMKQVPALSGKRKNKQSGASKGVWTPEQDQLLCELVNSGAYGDIKSASFWSRIAAALDDPSHSNYACRNRFIAQLKAGDRAVFRPDEDLRLQICSLVYGLRNWTKIAGHFDNRHAIRVRDRFDHLFALVGRRDSAFVGRKTSHRKPPLFAVTETPVSLKRTTTTTSTTLRTSDTKKF